MFSENLPITKDVENELTEFSEFYSPDVSNDSITELKLYIYCMKDVYRNIYFLLKPLCKLLGVDNNTRTNVFYFEKSENILNKYCVRGILIII